MIYVIGNEDGYVKIGITSGSIERRLRAIQTGSSTKLHVVRTWEPTGENSDRIGERILHRLFRYYRANGEWFHLPQEGIDWILGCAPDYFNQKEVSEMRFKDTSESTKETYPINVSPVVNVWLDKMSKETWLEKDDILDRLAKTTGDDLDTLLDIITRSRPMRISKPDQDTTNVLSATPRMSVDAAIEFNLDSVEGYWEYDTDNADTGSWWHGETSKEPEKWCVKMMEIMHCELERDEDGIYSAGYGKSIDKISAELRDAYSTASV